MNLYSIDTGLFKLDGGAMFGVVPKSIWQKTNPADENNMCTWAMRCLLIQDEDKLILVDTGIGNKMEPKQAGFFLPARGRFTNKIYSKIRLFGRRYNGCFSYPSALRSLRRQCKLQY